MKALWSFFLGSFMTVTFSTSLAATTPPVESTSTSSDLVVTQNLQIKSAYYNYNFGNVPVNYSRYHTFNLTNDSGRPVFVHFVNLWGQGFRGWNNCYGWLQPWQRCSAQVEFRPWYQGSYSGQLRFSLSTGDIFVNLWGVGYYW